MTRDRDEKRAEEQLLREFFAAAHADDRTPPFARLARPRTAPAATSHWRPAVAVVAVVAVALAVAWLIPRLTTTGGGVLSEEEQLALARELSSPESWRGPLDFLLETPGREILAAPPSFELTTLTIPPPAGAEEMLP